MPVTNLDEHAIFSVAIRIEDEDAREAYLTQVCGPDAALRDRVSALLRASRQNSSFLNSPPPGLSPTVETAKPTGLTGTVVGHYKILQEIGQGGFGVVYMAEQMKPIRRKVALKIVKPGMDTKELIARFETERQALAMMDHPSIARVFDAGTTDAGYPYFVMELVKGVAITQYADDNNLSTPQRLKLLAQVCRAVQHAHQKGVIHRDLKPSNVMVTMHDGNPVPKVIDFGVAKAILHPLTEKTLFTRYGQIIGTPQYMSPEQAEMSGLDVDTRSDIYSLGVLAYELLVGRPPFDGRALCEAGLDEMRRVIREEEPCAPSHMIRTLDVKTASTVATHRSCDRVALCRQLSGELDWITMRALEKDRNRRYETAAAMADDINRYLNDEPVDAGPLTLAYRARKAWRRNRAAIATASAIAASLFVGLIVAISGWLTTVDALAAEELARQQAEQAKEEAVTHQVEAEKQEKQATTEAENTRRTLELFLEVLAKSGINPESGHEYTVTQALDRVAERFDAGEQLLPATEAELHLGLAQAYLASGQRHRSQSHYRKAAEIGREVWPEGDRRLRDASREIAYLASSVDDLQKAVEIDRKSNDPSSLVKSLALLGSVAVEQGRLAVAKSAYQQAVDAFSLAGEDLRFIEIPHLAYADQLKNTGDLHEATRLEAEGLKIAKQMFWDRDQPWYGEVLRLSKTGEADAAQRALRVARQCERTVNAKRIYFLGHAVRYAGCFELADSIYNWGASVAGQDDDLDQEIWHMLSRSRLRFQARDLEGADQFYQQVMDVLEQRADRISPADLWARLEYGYLLRGMGRHDDAKRQFASTLEFLNANPEAAFYPGRELCRLLCLLSIGRGDEIRTEIGNYLTNTSTTQEHRNWLFLEQLLIEPHSVIEGINPVEVFEKQCRIGKPYPAAFFAPYDDAYVDWMANRDQLAEATIFLGDLVKQRDATFGPGNPDRAWTRVRLAKALLRADAELPRAKKLVEEAIVMLDNRPFVPGKRIDELHRLTGEIEARMQNDQ